MTPINCAIEDEAFTLAGLLPELARSPESGGQCVFEGIVRNHNQGQPVTRLRYECYAPLAIKEFNRIANEACERFSLTEVYVKHRAGELQIGDTAVAVITLARHRHEAFLGSRYIIDELKKRAPIWKKEFYEDGTASWPRCHEHSQELSYGQGN